MLRQFEGLAQNLVTKLKLVVKEKQILSGK